MASRRRVVDCGGGAAWADPVAGDFLVAGVVAALGTEVGPALAAFARALVTGGFGAGGFGAGDFGAGGVTAPRALAEGDFAAFGATDSFVADLGAVVFVTLARTRDPDSDLRELCGVFAALTGRAFAGATFALAELGDESRTVWGVSAACRVVFAFPIFADFADVSRGADVCCTSGFLDAVTARLGDATAGVEVSTRLDRFRVFTVAAGKSHNDTCATFPLLFALRGVDGTRLVAFVLPGCLTGFSALDRTAFFALTGRGTAVSVSLAALPVAFCVDDVAFAVILAVGVVARAFGFNTFTSATGAGGAGSFGAWPTRAPADAGADTATSCVGGGTLAMAVRVLRGFGVWLSGFVSTSAIVDAADFAAGAR